MGNLPKRFGSMPRYRPDAQRSGAKGGTWGWQKNAVMHIKLAFPYMDIINFEYLLIINGLNHLIFFRRTFDVLSMLRT